MLGGGKSKGDKELGKGLRVVLYLRWCTSQNKLSYVEITNNPLKL